VDRAAKAVLALKESDLGEIVTVPVEDYVTFSLLDGADYKDISDLSTGQRCTVILPLVLRHTDRLLIVDQPEDHIDNAFIVDTLIQSVLARPDDGQIIFSTHNANIPVLGNADFVIQLGSDGKRGFPLVANTLDAPPAVTAITTVMEGGAQAFASRAKFYNRQHVL
jgi:energy-coupling factor transporter ATP-binding protein EcfA2